MPGDDLTAPLGLKQRRFYHLPFGLFGISLMILLATTAFIWIGVVDDPFGGEPTASVKLSTDLKGVTQHDFTVVELPQALDNVLGPEDEPDVAPPLEGVTGPRHELAQKLAGAPMQAHVPLQSLLENGPYGAIPKVSENGLRPLDAYAEPAPNVATAQARIALVLNGIGLNETMSAMALDNLPSEVALAISPYGTDLDNWMSKARRNDNEVLLQIPMEPFDYPDNDAGPHSLLTKAASAQNADKLSWLMARTTNYIGLVNFMGQRFLSDNAALSLFMSEVNDRGLMFVDAAGSARSASKDVAMQTDTPFVQVDVVIDEDLDKSSIESRLLQVESLARSNGLAIASATTYPVTLRELERWTRSLEDRGLTLIPISAAIAAEHAQ
ncbi:divergent polysaccharide deacetylase family protein [Pseudovibrio sp. SPO723]|uniref:divergent polysaccharide deacetylase family protein n=1 Tax=Nesiotobacter zosterae TaxID=392721 RepID=UPI0029C552D1|nr:divergent polysaccharide deacetylase family protein [Pseudovibrio sp. SPO723]MDX5592159.1 divergent polysaccharide deacetylase family protein [Pseudovibrio sp. SPO723]